MSKRWLLFLSALLIFCIGFISLTSCGEYKTFTLKEDKLHFSFEYPASYRIVKGEIGSDVHNEIHYALLGLELKRREENHSWLEISYFSSSETSPNATATVERYLSTMSTQYDFKLLERKKVTIAGVQGEKIVFTTLDPNAKSFVPFTEKARLTHIDLTFDYRELIWSISIMSNEAVAETDKAAFEHMIKTFKILD